MRTPAIALLTMAALAAPSAARGQTVLFPDRALIPDLLAGPRDPVMKGQLVRTTRDPTEFGPGVGGEVAVGSALPVLRIGPNVVIGLEGGAFARFSFEEVQRDLVNTDWVFAVPVLWHRPNGWVRLRYYHTSSHLGDEYGRRFRATSPNFSRDGADLTAYHRVIPALGVYGLAFWSVNSHPTEALSWAFRAGAELDPARAVPGRFFAAADVELEESVEWKPRLAAQVGVWLPPAGHRPVRLALEAVAGPSPMGQFHSRDETRISLGLFWNP